MPEGKGPFPAGHGFMRANNGSNPNPAYREAQTREAWEEIDAFFAYLSAELRPAKKLHSR